MNEAHQLKKNPIVGLTPYWEDSDILSVDILRRIELEY